MLGQNCQLDSKAMKKEVGEMSMNAVEDTKVCNKHEHSSGIQVSKDGVIQSVVPLGGGDQMRVLILWGCAFKEDYGIPAFPLCFLAHEVSSWSYQVFVPSIMCIEEDQSNRDT